MTALSAAFQRTERGSRLSLKLGAYEFVQDEISKYAEENDINIVPRDTGERRSTGVPEVDRNSRHDIIRRINQDVVHVRNAILDITGVILDQLKVRADQDEKSR